MPLSRAASRSVTAAGRRLKKAALALGASGREPGTVTAAASASQARGTLVSIGLVQATVAIAAGRRRGVEKVIEPSVAREAVAPRLPAAGERDDRRADPARSRAS